MNRPEFLPTLPGDPLAALVHPEQAGQPVKKKAFHFLSVQEMFSNYRPPRWLIDGYLQEESICLLFGESTAGKSFAVIDWACCVSTGKPWHGCETAQGPVFYIAGEGFNGFVRRLRAWEIVNGTSTRDAPLYFSERPAELMNSESAVQVIEAVKGLMDAAGRPALIVVDTLHRNFGGGDENSAADFGLFLNHLDQMRLELGAAVVIVHHSGHTDGKRGRGSSAIRAAMDSEFCLRVEADKRRLLSCTKQKDAAAPEPMYLELRGVELEMLDSKGRPDSSAVLVAAGDQEAPTSSARETSKALDYIRQAIKVTGSNQKEVVRAQFYALYPGVAGTKRTAFIRGWKKYMNSFEEQPS